MDHVNDWAAGVLRTLDKAIPNDAIVVGQNFTQPASYPYDVLLTDQIILVDTSSAANTVTLPLSVAGFQVQVNDFTGTASVNNITIAAQVGEFINGAATYTMATDRQTVQVLGTGVVGNEWVVVGVGV